MGLLPFLVTDAPLEVLVMASAATMSLFNPVAVQFLCGDLSPPVHNLIVLDPVVSWAPPYFDQGSYYKACSFFFSIISVFDLITRSALFFFI